MRVTTALCLAAAAATADGYGHHKQHKKEYKTPAGECGRRGPWDPRRADPAPVLVTLNLLISKRATPDPGS